MLTGFGLNKESIRAIKDDIKNRDDIIGEHILKYRMRGFSEDEAERKAIDHYRRMSPSALAADNYVRGIAKTYKEAVISAMLGYSFLSTCELKKVR